MTAAEFNVARAWQPDRRSPRRWVFSYLVRQWPMLVGIVVGALGNAAGAAIMQSQIGAAFGEIARPDFSLAVVTQCALIIIGSQIGRGVLQFIRNFSADFAGQRLERDMRDELYASLLGKSMSFHDRQRIGDVLARASNDVRELNLMMSPGVNIVLGSGGFLIMPLLATPQIHPQLIAVPLAFLAAYFWLVRDYLTRLAPATDQVRASFGRLNTALSESIEGIETVKATAQEVRETRRFEATLADWIAATVKQGYTESRFLPLLLYGLAHAFGLWHSLSLFAAGQIDIGAVVAYNAMLTLFQFPTFASQFAYSQLASGFASARRILALINDDAGTFAQLKVAGGDGHAAPIRGEVAFRNVTFGYEGGRPALRDVSFTIKAGQTVAIVGQTGSGKTSIIKLLNRIYDVNDGEVLIDGVDVREWNLGALRRQISIIEQDIFLYSRDVAGNIAFGAPDADQEQVEAAARAAQADGFIHGFKDGYQTLVGERGVTLSGGQRQRIAIARAFLTDPHILILDDATSAIDSATEDEIQRAILRAAQGRTTFLITHRLSQIRWADVILVMRGGALEATGTHAELLERSPSYRAIFARQE
ncbi:MAG: ABC transporter ATP-binding protein/permease [Thermoflexales bacterium]|nr:ABC transporter ATP-binding protein/permease [Thermoflexales bacterium]